MSAEERVARVRPIRPDEASELRELRLRALREAPHAFTTTAEDAEQRDFVSWVEQADRGSRGQEWLTLVAEATSGMLCGMTSVAVDSQKPGCAELFQMWVDPQWRRSDLGRRLLAAAMEWAATKNLTLRLGVATDNEAALALYEGAGFRPTGEEEPMKGREGMTVKMYQLPDEV